MSLDNGDGGNGDENSSASRSMATSASTTLLATGVTTKNALNTTSPLYESKTLLCKNNCGYYGNSIQYDGYCSICYRKLKAKKGLASQTADLSAYGNTFLTSSASFDDTSSLLSLTGYDDGKMKHQQQPSQIWNEHANLNKFSSKTDNKNRGKFKIFRRSNNAPAGGPTSSPSSSSPSSSSLQQQQQQQQSNANNQQLISSNLSGMNLVDTVSRVADKAVNLVVDQTIPNSLLNTFNNSTSSLLSLSSSSYFTSSDTTNLIEFYTALNKLMASSLQSSSSAAAINSSILIPSYLVSDKSSSSLASLAANGTSDFTKTLTDFEEQFKVNFQQLYQDLVKQMKQFLDKFFDTFYKRNKDLPIDMVASNNKQSEAVQDFYKKIYKYVLTNASLKSYLEKLNSIRNININAVNQRSADNGMSDGGADGGNPSVITVSKQLKGSNMDEYYDKLNEAIMIWVECFINNSLYDYVFPSIMTEYEEQDMKLQKRIRSFYWITNEMIGTCIDEHSIFYRDSYEEALNYIVEMDSKRTAHEKMLCITECSKNIYKAINISTTIAVNIKEATLANSALASPLITPTNEEIPETTLVNVNNESGSKKKTKNASKSPASADDYLPAFIYIVLKANPTMLYSNINFITRFAFEKRILQGEHAYHFCSLNASIAHIENLNAHHLNMTQEEFESYCDGLMDQDSSSNVLKLINTNLKILGELKDKQKLLKQETLKLQSDITLFRKLMQNKFNQCLNNNKENYTQHILAANDSTGDQQRRPNQLANLLDDNNDLIKFNSNQPELVSSPIEPLVPLPIATDQTATTD